MTGNLPSEAQEKALRTLPAVATRQPYVDVFRGLLISHMALDHASLMFNAGRAAEELAASPAPDFGNVFQFLTRFTGVPVAPGFFFMAGFMIALTSGARENRGVPHAEVTRRLLIRGLVLIAVDALIMGGGQERERRSGTQNTAGIVATAVALQLIDAERDSEAIRIAELRGRLVKELQSRLDGVVETVPSSRKVAGAAHVCISGVESEALLFLLDEADVCASAASACASGAMEPSHVLRAMGVDRSAAMGALRLSLGHTTTETDIDRATDVIVAAVNQLRRR